MSGVAKGFLSAAIVYGLLGMMLGLHMAILQDHDQRPTHAHILVIGWLSFFAFGLFYLHFGHVARSWLAQIHFWLAQLGMLGIMIALAFVYSGHSEFDPVAGIAAITYALSFLIFAIVALPAIWSRDS